MDDRLGGSGDRGQPGAAGRPPRRAHHLRRSFDDTLEDEIRVTVIATGFEEAEGAMPNKPFSAAAEKKAEAQPQAPAAPAAPAEEDPFEDIFKIFNRGK